MLNVNVSEKLKVEQTMKPYELTCEHESLNSNGLENVMPTRAEEISSRERQGIIHAKWAGENDAKQYFHLLEDRTAGACYRGPNTVKKHPAAASLLLRS
eukprot:scaffold168633_cov39-Cyclotella_meneghiniana.AAC.2